MFLRCRGLSSRAVVKVDLDVDVRGVHGGVRPGEDGDGDVGFSGSLRAGAFAGVHGADGYGRALGVCHVHAFGEFVCGELEVDACLEPHLLHLLVVVRGFGQESHFLEEECFLVDDGWLCGVDAPGFIELEHGAHHVAVHLESP